MNDNELLQRITFNPGIFNGKPIIRGKRIAVEHILGMIAEGSTVEEILEGYPFLEREDIQACMIYAHRIVSHERVEPAIVTAQA
ncbi:MAG: DUF433 domain-containing protein [Candidatus Aminicenantes bacterium]|nr:MAG: DUF433 domain-containing protein [Candidatus Aminicenantes bacterium]